MSLGVGDVAAEPHACVAGGRRCGRPGLRPSGVRDDRARQAVELREVDASGSSTRVQIELKAQGLYRPGLPPARRRPRREMPKPRELDVQTRLIFHERIVPVGPDGLMPRSDSGTAKPSTGPPRRVARRSSGMSFKRPRRSTARFARRPRCFGREVALLVAEKRDRGWPVVVFSPAGPLSLVRARAGAGGGRPARSCRPPAGEAGGRGRSLESARRGRQGDERL